MAFSWEDYIAVARGLQEGSLQGINRDAVLRSSISRAYYGVFRFARDLAEPIGYVRCKKGDPLSDHQALPTFYKHLGRHYRDVGRGLERLREWRNACDYDDTLEFDLDSNSLAAIEEATRVVASLKGGGAPPRR